MQNTDKQRMKTHFIGLLGLKIKSNFLSNKVALSVRDKKVQ